MNKLKGMTSNFVCRVTVGGTPKWEIMDRPAAFGLDGECIRIIFQMEMNLKDRHATEWLNDLLSKNNFEWLKYYKGNWKVDIDLLFEYFKTKNIHNWAKGIVEPIFEIDQEEGTFDKNKKISVISFIITPKEVLNSMSKMIFLSHKGINKPIVRKYFETLKILGFSPWLDEDAMVAGDPLDRILLKGMKESCAAVFFITTDFKDENYLETEIDYAISEKRKKGDKFSIITLVFKDNSGKKGKTPELLERYVWKEPDDHLIALQEIIRALPIQLTGIDWK